MENKYLIIICTLIIIIAVLVVGIVVLTTNNGDGNSDILGGITNPFGDGVVLKISSDDKNLSGTAKVFEFSDVEKNSNGTWNLSEFGDYYGLWGFDWSNNGAAMDISIVNGEAEYNLTNTTKVFCVYPFLTELSSNSTVTVDLYVNGQKKLSSVCKPYGDLDGGYQADINFGSKLIDMNGNPIPDKDLVPDTEHNKFKNNNY